MAELKKQFIHEEHEDKRIEVLWLNEDDMVEAGVLDAGRAVDVMEETMGLLEDGDTIMGGPNHDAHGLMLSFPKHSSIPNFPLNDSRDRRFIAMPAYVGGRFHLSGCKWYGSNGRNRSKGLPRSILMMLLNDVETGAPLAYMSANLLSSIRTGAMPGLAAKILANPDSKVLALIGPGVINKACCMAILSKMKHIRTIRIKGSSPQSKSALVMKQFIEDEFPMIEHIELCETLEEAIRGADIVSEAVSCKEGEWPRYDASWFKKGAVIISASTFYMDYKSILPFRKVVDNYGMYQNYADEDREEITKDENGERMHTGCMGEDFVYMVEDGLIPRESIEELGEIIRGKKPGRTSTDEIFLVSIEGMPIEDVAWGYECYTKAKEEGIGETLKLWDEPIAF
ncbi:MAG: ornithine cyclodeaminase [Lachnospiraceae bacterium]|nr:ornithine cyclodeaminase [Lachnospiraceae bacterium]